MPFASFTRIREVSSEDDQHLAENLIKPKQGKKWKTKSVGEKSAYVILEMEEALQITGIDIGNEHSAFVEVLVGRSSCAPHDFTEILITCSFMTPIESRNSNNANRVRCFSEDALVSTAVEKKWSLLKIICTQPFNKHVQYGLSFIKVHCVSESQSKKNTILVPRTILAHNKTTEISENDRKQSPFHIGKFKIREDSPDSENDGASSLFSRWRKCKDDKSELTTAASIRMASTNIVPHINRDIADKPKKNLKTELLDRNRDLLLFGEADDVESEREVRLEKEIEADRERRRLELQKQAENKQKEKPKSIDTKRPKRDNDKSAVEKETFNLVKTTSASTSVSTTKNVNSTDETSTIDCNKKRPSSSPNDRPSKKIKGSIKFRPFNQLLRGVVLVISGIQNPDRGDLRNKAIALGAKYKGDWDNTCTHLICAFKNTPKYNQVRGKGKIITRTWIEKCYNSMKYLPWRRYALDSLELAKPESDEEILDESLQPQSTVDEVLKASNVATSRRESEDRNDTLSLYDYDLEVQPSKIPITKNVFVSSSDSDTDDEILRVEGKNANQNPVSSSNLLLKNEGDDIKQKYKCCENKPSPVSSKTFGDIYEASTDEEEYLQSKQQQSSSQILI